MKKKRKENKLFRRKRYKQTSLNSYGNTVEGRTLEQKIRKMIANGEPLGTGTDQAQIIFQERSAGVEAQYDIRTDRFDVAVDVADKVSKSKAAKRQAKAKKDDTKQTSSSDSSDDSN